jgi:GDP-D-mannose 3', 5'-epimerase
MPPIVGLRLPRRQADPHRRHRLSSDAENGAAKLSGGHEIEILGDGEQTHSFMHIDEYTDGTIRLAYGDIVEPLNIGSWSASTRLVDRDCRQCEAQALLQARPAQGHAQVHQRQRADEEPPVGVSIRLEDGMKNLLREEMTSGKASIGNALPRATIVTA